MSSVWIVCKNVAFRERHWEVLHKALCKHTISANVSVLARAVLLPRPPLPVCHFLSIHLRHCWSSGQLMLFPWQCHSWCWGGVVMVTLVYFAVRWFQLMPRTCLSGTLIPWRMCSEKWGESREVGEREPNYMSYWLFSFCQVCCFSLDTVTVGDVAIATFVSAVSTFLMQSGSIQN